VRKIERNQFTFYKSFYDSIQKIKKASDRAKAYDAICEFALYEKMPDVDSLPDTVSIVFTMVLPNLEASRKKAEAGKQGGSKPKANGKQNESKTEANWKQEKEQDKDKDKGKEQVLIPTLSDVEAFCSASGLKTDPAYFWNYYQSRGWSGVKDWQARLMAWETRDHKQTDQFTYGSEELKAIEELKKRRTS
jgi:hypothetical protein